MRALGLKLRAQTFQVYKRGTPCTFALTISPSPFFKSSYDCSLICEICCIWGFGLNDISHCTLFIFSLLVKFDSPSSIDINYNF